MTDLTELDPDSLREQLQPDGDADPADLTVPQLRYAIRVCLDRRPDYNALRHGDLEAAYEAIAGSQLESPTVSRLRYHITQQLGGVEASSFQAATPLTREILETLCEELRDE